MLHRPILTPFAASVYPQSLSPAPEFNLERPHGIDFRLTHSACCDNLAGRLVRDRYRLGFPVQLPVPQAAMFGRPLQGKE